VCDGSRAATVESVNAATAGPTRASVASSLVVLAVLAGAAAPAAAAEPTAGVGGSAPAGVWPLSPGPDQVVRGFDPPDCTWCGGHRGVDLAGGALAPVRAAIAGTVTFAGPLAGRGVVVVDDGTERTTYEPVTASVHRGAVVAAGAVIGTLAVPGSHCFPAACLHLGLIRDSDDAYLDPLTLFGETGPKPVRLLPLWRQAPAVLLSVVAFVAAVTGVKVS
jgi:murein DD-endopeptidase MepM/ murein hydrolase activator NlpD